MTLLFAVASAAPWTPLTLDESRALRVAEVSLDQGKVCVRTVDRKVACWGEYVTLGADGWAPPSRLPMLLTGVADAVDIAVGGALYVAREDGTVHSIREAELAPVPGFVGVVQLEQAGNGVCGRSRAGTVACHGWIDWIEGDEDAASPLRLAPGVGLECGHQGCCTWDQGGVLSCVGDQEGLGLGKKPSLPKAAPRSGVEALSMSGSQACARVDGAHRCWGDPLPEGFAPPKGSVVALHYDQPCFVEEKGRMTCDDRGEPWTMEGVSAVALSDMTHCLVRRDGGLWCWGDNEDGELLDGTALARPEPMEVPGVRATALSAGYQSTCAVQGQDLVCWGMGDGRPTVVGPAPDRFADAQYAPGCGWWGSAAYCVTRYHDGWDREPLSGLAGKAFAIDRAGNVCRIDASGAVSCLFSLGEGGIDPTWRPLAVPEPAVAIAAAGLGMGVLGASGAVHRWDDARFDADPDFVDVPEGPSRTTPVPDIAGARLVAGHQNGGCAVTDRGLSCWGGLGWSSTGVPPNPAFAGATSIDANHFHVCGVVDGRVLCFGDPEHGVLGRSSPERFVAEPVEVALPGRAAQVVTGSEHTCARLEDERVFCWGGDADGQLGVGRMRRVDRPIPSLVGPSAP